MFVLEKTYRQRSDGALGALERSICLYRSVPYRTCR